MDKLIKKDLTIIASIVLVHTILIFCLQKVLSPIHYLPHNLFIFELIGKGVYLPTWTFFVFNTANLVLIWLIGRNIFKNKLSFIPPTVWALSPWSYYLTISGSFYIYLLFLILLLIYGCTLITSKKMVFSLSLVLFALIAGLYSSFLLSITILSAAILALIFKITDFKYLKKVVLILAISTIPLILLIVGNRTGFKNIVNSEVRLFSDPILLNSVNRYQGAAEEVGLKPLARISQNKYIFFTEYVVFKYVKQFVPSTFFTSNEKLLNFSFTSPILIGFLIPFVYGLFYLLGNYLTRQYVAISTILAVPSILAVGSVSLNHLVIFSPIVIIIISYGITLMIERTSTKKVFLFLLVTIILVIFQTVITISDIKIREKSRYNKYFGDNYSLGNQ